MEQIRLTYWEAILIGTLVGVVVGFLLGLIPLILGIRKGKKRLGIYGLLSSIVGGAISTILSLVIVGVFIYLILKKPLEVRVVNENPIDVKIDDSENR